jgi:1-pyrroline-5-carboxylate dehydrogenase
LVQRHEVRTSVQPHLVESTRALVIGDPTLPGTDFGPVIDEEAANKIREYIEIGMREGKLELAHTVPGTQSSFGEADRHRTSSATSSRTMLANEIGPVLYVMVKDF